MHTGNTSPRLPEAPLPTLMKALKERLKDFFQSAPFLILIAEKICSTGFVFLIFYGFLDIYRFIFRDKRF
jgi:hypothetical protein